jgi:hypothetical protein
MYRGKKNGGYAPTSPGVEIEMPMLYVFFFSEHASSNKLQSPNWLIQDRDLQNYSIGPSDFSLHRNAVSVHALAV